MQRINRAMLAMMENAANSHNKRNGELMTETAVEVQCFDQEHGKYRDLPGMTSCAIYSASD